MLKMILKWGFGSISCFWGLKTVLRKPQGENGGMINLILKVAFLFSVFSTTPFQKSTEFLAEYFFREELLFFGGPRILFEVNPYHPKHLLSFFSLALNVHVLFYLIFFKQHMFTEEKKVLFFQIFASRPILHFLNQKIFFL